ncbi:MAG: SRPBCC domain-containing protein [Bacteroidia bacterium]|nr:SRPBCC domain-containing protein [Bacteroidia bacterium]
MSLEIKTTIEINASSGKVWQVFTDFDSYPKWNPFIKKLIGNVEEGATIEIQLPGMTFKPNVQVYRKNSELKWLGHLLFKGLFDGQHRFQLIEKEGVTTFVHSEKFNGILVPLFKKKLISETKLEFEEMNRALKKRVEVTA